MISALWKFRTVKGDVHMMKKKILASLLVGSAVVGASLAPLSAQAVTTGNTPVTVGFEGGTLPNDENPSGTSKAPDPDAVNTDFDLIVIPVGFNFNNIKLSGPLTNIPASNSTQVYGVGDLRGTKAGWHVTAEIKEMKNGTDLLQGKLNFNQVMTYAKYNDPRYPGNDYSFYDSADGDPAAPSGIASNLSIGGGATLMAQAEAGKGQGIWGFNMRESTLDVTSSVSNIRIGNYTGNITWNLVAGPSI
ncbi:WxL domain-containing protein [Enterococcus faecalis]|uniref:WxL domain-containing protein n=2 Tax=Enterococcus faecalis TaxID=1351 RepID=UPI00200D9CDB|nr:WxL domain-containing protein [Enterococcus faecalis]UQF25501.1 WxL domain-containing protein [Enterococcus faecalis]UQR17864.1 WxL domain-containing protein [Enterococcus faecalis]WCG39885.1 WxL domain-containing protein [Enterococcus faecalis]WCG50325.1 WxL domain-containing protein [Enterococcus faecalis]WCG71623.1 WxL domain-containing protein [Enterococcus faecalis]